MMLEVLLTSTVVAGLVAGLVSLRVSERRIAIENITQERAKWRNRVRELSAQVHIAIIESDSNKLSELRSAFALLLNPHHEEDRAIINAISVADEHEEHKAKEFSDRVSLLLKHDWERAKREAKPVFFRGKEPQRVTYAEYRQSIAR